MKRVTSIVLVLLLIGGMAGAWLQRQALYDWARLRGYEPPVAIAQLATDTTMTDQARRIFYVYRPELNDRTAFGQNCTNDSEETIVLGCYVSNIGIYLFDVDDPRLQGVEQVTAAHELLHAAYGRLSSKERARIDTLTEQTFTTLGDERIKATIENYRLRDPSIVSDELHSIIATEVRDIPAELETYYRRYFTNRLEIVAFSERYEGVLSERRNRLNSLEHEISGLKNEIDQLETTLTTERDSLQRDRSGVNTEAEAAAFNTRVNAYNANVRELNALIRQHNALIEEFKANALEQQELFQALNSRPTL